MENRFKDQEDFVKKMRESTFDICMAVPSEKTGSWRHMKQIDLRKNLSEEVSDPKILTILTECGYLTKRNSQITQKYIDASEADIEREVRAIKSDIKSDAIKEETERIFSAINESCKDSRDFLQKYFVSKVHVNDLSDTFSERLESKVKFMIVPIPGL